MNKPLQIVSLEKMINKHIGKPGTTNRELFEKELKIDLSFYLKKQAIRKRSETTP